MTSVSTTLLNNDFSVVDIVWKSDTTSTVENWVTTGSTEPTYISNSTNSLGLDGGLVAAAIVAPIVAIGLSVAAALIFRRYTLQLRRKEMLNIKRAKKSRAINVKVWPDNSKQPRRGGGKVESLRSSVAENARLKTLLRQSMVVDTKLQRVSTLATAIELAL